MKFKKPYVIAELGINHNGSIKIGKKLILNAKKSGVNAVKFQTYIPELRFGTKHKFFEIFKKYHLKFEDELVLWKYAKHVGLDVMTSPFDPESVDFCKVNKKLLSGIKIASFETTNLKLVRLVSSLKLKTFFSTGQNNLSEIQKTIKNINKYHNKIVPMHCISSYPTRNHDSNLIVIKFLQNKLKREIGFSDHSLGSRISIYASCLGISHIEKHFTINNKMNGPDHKFSMNPITMSELIKGIKDLELIMGSPWMGVRPYEKLIYSEVRRVSK